MAVSESSEFLTKVFVNQDRLFDSSLDSFHTGPGDRKKIVGVSKSSILPQFRRRNMRKGKRVKKSVGKQINVEKGKWRGKWKF